MNFGRYCQLMDARRWLLSGVGGVLFASTFFAQAQPEAKPRARDLGIPFVGQPGPLNAITDVKGLEVGHTTLISGDGKLVIGKGPVRTGVTAILPTGKTFRPVFAAWHSLNGNGEMTGTTWIEESGYLEEPVLISNTHSIGAVSEASIAWRAKAGYHAEGDGWGWASLPVVAETWDGRLNDIHGFHVQRRHVFAALDGARGGRVAEGNVGGGTGMVCHRFKSGIGTASRKMANGYTVGVLVQANYGQREDLTIAGVPVGRELSDLKPVMNGLDPKADGGSIIAIVATDAPLAPHQLKRLAKRVSLGVGKTGGIGSNSSGDIFLAFSTSEAMKKNDKGLVQLEMIPNDEIDPFFRAVIQATEESVINALVAAETMTGINGNTVYAIPHDRLRATLRKYNRLEER
jgi:D-aminopeptidase